MALIAGACTEATPQGKPRDGASARSTARLDGLQAVMADPDGVPSFINGQLGAVPTEKDAVQSLQAEQMRPVLEGVASLFRLEPEDLQFKKAYVGFDGDAHFRYGVRRNGIDVLGGELRLHARNGAVFAANTNMRGDLLAPDKARISPETAVTAARADRSSPAGATVSRAPRLVYWREGNQLVLAYEVRIQGMGADGLPVDDSVLVNARSGDVFERHSHVHTALARTMYVGNGDVVVRAEGQPPVEDPLVNLGYEHLGSVYRCYRELFGRDSYDNAGMPLVGRAFHNGLFAGAFLSGTEMVFGDDFNKDHAELARAVDIPAHEMTHAVTNLESNLVYSGEPGALNEAISDIFGAVCEWHHRGRVLDANTWRIGEDIFTPGIPGGAVRYMDNPRLDGHSLDFFSDYQPNTTLHYASGIANLAFYLLSQGGFHPRLPAQVPVTGLGIEKAARIFYKLNVDLLLPTTHFEVAKVLSEQAAAQLGYDVATVASVRNAWLAVGVGLPPSFPGQVLLEKDLPITGLSGQQTQRRYFGAAVPEGATDLTFTLSGGTGDADLYVRWAGFPTTTLYDCRPYRTGNNEVCTFAAPAAGNWYVLLNGFSAYAGASLVVTWKNGYVPLEPGVQVTGLSGDAGSYHGYMVQIPEREDGGTRNIHARLRGMGNADLYVRYEAMPTFFSYDCRGMNEHGTENCDLNGFAPGRYYVQVFGAKGGYSDGSLVVTYD